MQQIYRQRVNIALTRLTLLINMPNSAAKGLRQTLSLVLTVANVVDKLDDVRGGAIVVVFGSSFPFVVEESSQSSERRPLTCCIRRLALGGGVGVIDGACAEELGEEAEGGDEEGDLHCSK